MLHEKIKMNKSSKSGHEAKVDVPKTINSNSKTYENNTLFEADRDSIDKENTEKISKMSREEIEEERQKLLETLGITFYLLL